MTDATANIQCPLCGFRFSKSAESACKSCPLNNKDCNLICCPNCGYQWAEESQVVKRIKKWFGKKEVSGEKKD